MQDEVERMLMDLNPVLHLDFLVAHSPLHGILDLAYGETHIGSSVLTNCLDFRFDKTIKPTYFVHGHEHRDNGICYYNNMLIINSACTQHTIQL